MDIKLQNTGDLDLVSDFRFIDGTEQHKMTVLVASKGEIKHRPDVGVGVGFYLLENNPADLLRAARINCQKIGIKVNAVYFSGKHLKIE